MKKREPKPKKEVALFTDEIHRKIFNFQPPMPSGTHASPANGIFPLGYSKRDFRRR